MTKRSETIKNSSRYANATPKTGQTGVDQLAQLAMPKASLARLSAIRLTDRVVLEMKADAKTAADIRDFPLEEAGTFFVPLRLGTVQVAGAVYNANGYRHEPDKQLGVYLNDDRRATSEADPMRVFVVRADGTVVSPQARKKHFHNDFAKLRFFPGDSIVIPENLRLPSNQVNEFLKFTQFASQIALTATALSVIQ